MSQLTGADGARPDEGSRRWMVAGVLGIAAVAALLALAGCDLQRIQELEEGVSTEADVRKRFGEPAAVHPEAGGARTLEYPRQPEGETTYMITIGADGKMSRLRQVLRRDIFATITPGMDRAEVRRLIGRPARVQPYELKRQEDWDWRFADSGQTRLFVVTFDAAGKVVSTAYQVDPKTTEAGGGPGR